MCLKKVERQCWPWSQREGDPLEVEEDRKEPSTEEEIALLGMPETPKQNAVHDAVVLRAGC